MSRPVDSDRPGITLPVHSATMGEAYSRFWRKGLTFSGRASRSEFWKVASIHLVLLVLVYGFVYFSEYVYYYAGTWAVWIFLLAMLAYSLAATIPGFAITVRRLHDANYSGAMLLLCFVPFVGPFILLILYAMPSHAAGARFDAIGAQGHRANGGSQTHPIGHPDPVAPEAPVAAPAPLPVRLASDPLPHGFGSAPSTPPPPPPPSTSMAPAFSSSATPVPAASFPPPPPSDPGSVGPAPLPDVAGSAPISGIPGYAPQAAPVLPSVSAAPAATFTPAPYPVQAEPAYDLDETRVAVPVAPPVVPKSWTLRLPDGSSLAAEGVVYLGRNPAASAEHPGAKIVPIVDTAGSMSKTHASVLATVNGLEITDLHSTNGTRVTIAGGAPERLTPGVPYGLVGGGTVALGDVVIEVTPPA